MSGVHFVEAFKVCGVGLYTLFSWVLTEFCSKVVGAQGMIFRIPPSLVRQYQNKTIPVLQGHSCILMPASLTLVKTVLACNRHITVQLQQSHLTSYS